MRIGLTLLLAVCLAASALTQDVQAQEIKIGIVQDKAPAKYLVVTEGIVGGFAPAHVKTQIVILQRDGKYHVMVMKQPDRRAEKTYRQGTLQVNEFAGLFRGLARQGVFELPREMPAGCQDIYKLDTSLAVFSDGKFWRNGGPGGCVRGQSKVQPNADQLKTFDHVISVLKSWSDKKTTAAADAKAFNETLQLVQRDAAKRGQAKVPQRLGPPVRLGQPPRARVLPVQPNAPPRKIQPVKPEKEID